jgi:hypothetical protein
VALIGIVVVAALDRGLLRARRERPRGRAAKERDELAPLHSITSSARARKGSGIVRPIAFAALTLTTSSNLVVHYGKIAGLVALEDPSGIAADLMIRLSQAGPVAHQAAGGSKFAHLIDRGHSARRIWLKDLNTRFSERTTG